MKLQRQKQGFSFGFFGVLAFVVLWGSWAWASEKVCVKFLQSKQNREAARCFDGLVAGVKEPKREEQRFQKGRWLRGAWLSYLRASKMATKPEVKAYLLEQVVARIRVYLAETLYETASEKSAAESQKTGAMAAIGYADLSVVSGSQKAVIEVSGFEFQAKGLGDWTQKVRPGSYTVRLRYPGQAVQVKIAMVKSRQPNIVQFGPSKPVVRRPVTPRSVVRPRQEPGKRVALREQSGPIKSSPSPIARYLPWALVGVGGALLLAGGGGLALGRVAYADAENAKEKLRQGQADLDTTKEYNQAIGAANTRLTVGWVGLGLGALVAGAGAVLLLNPSLLAPKRAEKTATSIKSNRLGFSQVLVSIGG